MRIINHLMEYGYIQDVDVPCLFKHHERGTIFTLVVDDFAIKYKYVGCHHLPAQSMFTIGCC